MYIRLTLFRQNRGGAAKIAFAEFDGLKLVQSSRFIYFTLFTINQHRKKSLVTQNYKIKIITVRVIEMCMVVKVAKAF